MSLFPGKLYKQDLLSLHITQCFIILFLINCTYLWCRLKHGHDAHPLELIVKGSDLVWH